MGTGRRRKNLIPSGSSPPASFQATSNENNRNLMKNQLGGVIFGCTNSTIKECLSKQLFGWLSTVNCKLYLLFCFHS